jgi:DNA-binding winged helix-turn-helix (wHTH) protein
MNMLRFGGCEFDPTTGELRRDDRLIRLRPQPAAVLVYLAARRGRVVSRDELRHQLWGGDIYVQFDAGLNSCMKQIRRALADDARSPTYIETLWRRGYRFLPAVDHFHFDDDDALVRPVRDSIRI